MILVLVSFKLDIYAFLNAFTSNRHGVLDSPMNHVVRNVCDEVVLIW